MKCEFWKEVGILAKLVNSHRLQELFVSHLRPGLFTVKHDAVSDG